MKMEINQEIITSMIKYQIIFQKSYKFQKFVAKIDERFCKIKIRFIITYTLLVSFILFE